ncbi:MAG: hypothetical protein WC223_14015 [Bacteroidales bacterium]|jgi:hypothetical protein
MVNKKLINKIGIGLFIAFILYAITISMIKWIKLENSHMYTIGILYKIGGGARSGISLYYKYNVNDKCFDVVHTQVTKNTILPSKAEIGKRYYVKFETGNPINSEMLTDYPVPDNMKEAPKEGWEKIPKE